MKRIKINTSGIIIILLFLSVILISCDKESSIGLELLPSGDLITIGGEVIKDDISAYTFTEKNARTDETINSLLGSLRDPIFGTTNINFAAQFRLIEFPDFGENPSVDSVKLYLYYSRIYGDTVTHQKFKVYELESGLDVDAIYTKDIDLKALASDQLLGEVDYRPRVSLDSATSDTLYQLITIPIDNSLGEKLMAADSLQMISNDVFLEYFKGLLIETEPVTGDDSGTILSLEAAYSGGFLGSGLLLYYSNDSTELFGIDTSFVEPYLISPFSARVNSITHDYSATSFFEHLDTEGYEDSLIYIQASGGLKAKIFIDDLSSWSDSVNTAINKAQLIFQIDTILSQVEKYPPPNRLYFTYIDTADEEQVPDDFYFNSDYYGGVLDTVDYTYRFNITQHLQNIIEGENNLGFYLTTGQVADRANRVVLRGSKGTSAIRLIITYTKYNI